MGRLRLVREVWIGEAYAEEEWIEEWEDYPEGAADLSAPDVQSEDADEGTGPE